GRQPLLREALLSGGDPMVLSNRALFEYMAWLAELGIARIRVGTKELAFRPQRFDSAFFAALDAFHDAYPNGHILFITHFTHPHEFLVYTSTLCSLAHYSWLPEVLSAVHALRARAFVSIQNQTPLIAGINDDSWALRIIQHCMCEHAIGNYYFFQCREVIG